MIRIRADCKLSAKPSLIDLKSDHRDFVRRSLGCIHRPCVHRRGEKREEGIRNGRKGEAKVHPRRVERCNRGSVIRSTNMNARVAP